VGIPWPKRNLPSRVATSSGVETEKELPGGLLMAWPLSPRPRTPAAAKTLKGA